MSLAKCFGDIKNAPTNAAELKKYLVAEYKALAEEAKANGFAMTENNIDALLSFDTNPTTKAKKILDNPDSIPEQKIKITNGETGIIYAPWFDSDRLEPPKINEDGSVTPGGIFLSGAFIAKYIPNYRSLPEDELWAAIDERILKNIIGYRIPNQGLASSDALVVMGILPDEIGNTVVPYIGFTTKTGSDFDIDKMYVMMPYFDAKRGSYDQGYKYIQENELTTEEMKAELLAVGFLESWVLGLSEGETKKFFVESVLYGLHIDTSADSLYHDDFTENYDVDAAARLEYIEFDPNRPIHEQSRKAIMNRVIETYKSVLLHPKNIAEVMNPIDVEDIREYITYLAELGGVRQDTSGQPLDMVDGVDDIKSRMQYRHGKAGLGQNINALVDSIRGSMADLELNVKLPFAQNTKLDNEFSNDPINPEQYRLTTAMMALVNGFVDIAKDKYIVEGNFVPATNGVAFALLRAGVHPFTVAAFLAQPIIIEYVQFMSNRDSTFLDGSEFTIGKFKLMKIRSALSAEAQAEWDKLGPKINRIVSERNSPEEMISIIDELTSKLPDAIREEIKTTAIKVHRPNSNPVTREQMEAAIRDGDTNTDFQFMMLADFIRAERIARAVTQSVQASKIDVDGIGKDVTSAHINNQRIVDALENPVLKGFDTKLETDGAPTLLGTVLGNVLNFGMKLIRNNPRFFPTGTKAAQATVNILNKTITALTGRPLTQEVGQRIENDLITYILAGFPPFVMTQANKANLMQRMPAKLLELKEKYGEDNALIKYLDVKKNPVPIEIAPGISVQYYITLNLTTKSAEFKNELVEAWEDLLQSDPEFAEQLIQYSYFTSGFTSRIETFHEYVPFSWLNKNGIASYLRELSNYDTPFYNKFLTQFFLNNPDLIPDISVSRIKQSPLSEGVSHRVGFTYEAEGGLPLFFRTVEYDMAGNRYERFYRLRGIDPNNPQLGYYTRIKPLNIRTGIGLNIKQFAFEKGIPIADIFGGESLTARDVEAFKDIEAKIRDGRLSPPTAQFPGSPSYMNYITSGQDVNEVLDDDIDDSEELGPATDPDVVGSISPSDRYGSEFNKVVDLVNEANKTEAPLTMLANSLGIESGNLLTLFMIMDKYGTTIEIDGMSKHSMSIRRKADSLKGHTIVVNPTLLVQTRDEYYSDKSVEELFHDFLLHEAVHYMLRAIHISHFATGNAAKMLNFGHMRHFDAELNGLYKRAKAKVDEVIANGEFNNYPPELQAKLKYMFFTAPNAGNMEELITFALTDVQVQEWMKSQYVKVPGNKILRSLWEMFLEIFGLRLEDVGTDNILADVMDVLGRTYINNEVFRRFQDTIQGNTRAANDDFPLATMIDAGVFSENPWNSVLTESLMRGGEIKSASAGKVSKSGNLRGLEKLVGKTISPRSANDTGKNTAGPIKKGDKIYEREFYMVSAYKIKAAVEAGTVVEFFNILGDSEVNAEFLPLYQMMDEMGVGIAVADIPESPAIIIPLMDNNGKLQLVINSTRTDIVSLQKGANMTHLRTYLHGGMIQLMLMNLTNTIGDLKARNTIDNDTDDDLVNKLFTQEFQNLRQLILDNIDNAPANVKHLKQPIQDAEDMLQLIANLLTLPMVVQWMQTVRGPYENESTPSIWSYFLTYSGVNRHGDVGDYNLLAELMNILEALNQITTQPDIVALTQYRKDLNDPRDGDTLGALSAPSYSNVKSFATTSGIMTDTMLPLYQLADAMGVQIKPVTDVNDRNSIAEFEWNSKSDTMQGATIGIYMENLEAKAKRTGMTQQALLAQALHHELIHMLLISTTKGGGKAGRKAGRELGYKLNGLRERGLAFLIEDMQAGNLDSGLESKLIQVFNPGNNIPGYRTDELITYALTDPEVAAWMKSKKYPTKNEFKKSLWDLFLDFVGLTFEYIGRDNMLADVVGVITTHQIHNTQLVMLGDIASLDSSQRVRGVGYMSAYDILNDPFRDMNNNPYC